MEIRGPFESPRPGSWRCRLIREGQRIWLPMASTRAEALKIAELCVKEIDRDALTVDEAIERYGEYLRDDRGNKPRSCKDTVARLRLFFPRQRTLLRELTPARCTSMYQNLVKAPSSRTRKPLSPDTHRNYLAEAKTFLAWCVQRKHLRANPLKEVQGVGRRSHGKAQLTADEARRWLDTASQLFATEPGALAAALLLLCGLRCSEVTERTIRDLDEGGTVLRIPRGKTRAAIRAVAIPDFIRPYLIALGHGRPRTELLFGQHWRDWPRHWVKRICVAAGLPEVCAHSMRGLHATLSVSAGMSPHVVAASLGHEC